MKKLLLVLLLASSTLLLGAGGQQSPRPYYEGKIITLIVPFGAGGATDVRGRLIAEHLKRHIPGNPTILVENKPGGGGAVGFNHG